MPLSLVKVLGLLRNFENLGENSVFSPSSLWKLVKSEEVSWEIGISLASGNIVSYCCQCGGFEMVFGKSTTVGGSLTPSCHCFKVANLKGAVVDADQISNLKDCYILGEQLGLGQLGVIRACADNFTGEFFACKSIAKDRLITQDNVGSVKLEIEIMTRSPKCVWSKSHTRRKIMLIWRWSFVLEGGCSTN